ncbi:putative T7SS-secreted protein [Nocardia sp. CA-290969]|uniref:putative T7SS-secreted protein n=1 Tax=Nocardia sp. CA-290969 TaxID=3239986 RepID=UPI003D8EE54B
MGIFEAAWDGITDAVDAVGEAVEDGVEAAIETGGELIDDGLDLLADGANALGLEDAAETLDDLGDSVASATGGDVEERELGQTEDPAELILGVPPDIAGAVSSLDEISGGLGATGEALTKIDKSGWTGEGAEAFDAAFDPQPRLWADTAEALGDAAAALDTWREVVRVAQAAAQTAIDRWKAAQAEFTRQRDWWNSLTAEQQSQTTLVDTWTPIAEDARSILRNARIDRDNGAAAAVAAINAAIAKAPDEPGFTERWGNNALDLLNAGNQMFTNFAAGLLTSLTGLVQFVRQVNPLDTYNLTHPADYAKGMSDLATGLVATAADPGAVVDQMIEDVKANPMEALGALTGDALLSVATGGAGAAKTPVTVVRKAAGAAKKAVDMARKASPRSSSLPDGRHPSYPAHDTPGSNPRESQDDSPTPQLDIGHDQPRAGAADNSTPDDPDSGPLQTEHRPDSPEPTRDPTDSGDDPGPDRTEEAAPEQRETPRDTTPEPDRESTPESRSDTSPSSAGTDRTDHPDRTDRPEREVTPDRETTSNTSPDTRADSPSDTTQDRPSDTHRDRPSGTDRDSTPDSGARPDRDTDHGGDRTPNQTARDDDVPNQATRPDQDGTADSGSHQDPDRTPETGPHPDSETPSDPAASPDADTTPDSTGRPDRDDSPAPDTHQDPGSTHDDHTDPESTASSPEHTPRESDSTPGYLPTTHTGSPSATTPEARPDPARSPAARAADPDSRTSSPATRPDTSNSSPDSARSPSSPARPESRSSETPRSSPARPDSSPGARRSDASPGDTGSPSRDSSPDHPSHRSPESAKTPDNQKDSTPEATPDRSRDPSSRSGRDGDTDRNRDRDHDRDQDATTNRSEHGDRDRQGNPDAGSRRDPERDPGRDHDSGRERTPDGDRDSGRDRNPDRDGDSDHDPDTPPHSRDPDPDSSTPESRAEADHGAYDHARDAGADRNRDPDQRECSEDPVDICTGAFLLPETDAELPGVLPLTLRRGHHSDYSFGRWFGPSWSATLDARLVIEDEGVTFVAEDGMMVAYPHAEVGVPVDPLISGRPWSLLRTETGGYRIRDRRRELIWHFAPEPEIGGLDIRLGNYAVSAITDRHHNRIRFHYDRDGAPVEVTHSGGYRIRVSTAHGRITGLALVTGDGTTTPLRTFTYDGGNLVAVTDAAGTAIRYTYDAENRMTSWTDSNGNRMVNTYDAAGRVIGQHGTGGVLDTRFDYFEFPDGSGRTTAVTDSTGATTHYGFDRDLRLRDHLDPAGGHTHIDYNADRNPLEVIAPDGARTSYRYNPAGDIAKIVRPDGYSIDFEYFWKNRPSAVTGPDGAVTRREWDERGNLIATVDAAGDRTEYTYHPSGALATIVESHGARTVVDVDAAGLPIRITDPLGAVTHLDRDSAGRPVRVTGADGAVTRYDWSPTGKLLRRTDPDGHSESWTYDGEGNVRTHTDRAGHVTRLTYGAFDLLASRTEPDGSTTRYTWDTQRRLTAVHNPVGDTWTYTYDRAGRLIAETDYTGATTTYTHDTAGRLATVTPATGITRRHRHDILGRVTEIAADSGEWVRYTHDPAGRTLQAITGSGDAPAHTLEFAYTPAGALVAEQVDDRAALRFGYDIRGRRTERISPSGAVTTWGHDVLGRPDRMQADSHDITFAYDPSGALTRWQIDEVAITRERTAVGRVTGQEVIAFPEKLLDFDLAGARPAPRRLRRDDYTYRPDGYLTTHTVTRPTHSALGTTETSTRRDYTLDPLGRVTTVTSAGRTLEQYAYDALGNITAGPPETTHPPETAPPEPSNAAARPLPAPNPHREYRNNLLIRDGRTRYHYDPAGRLIRKTTTRLSRKPDVWHYRYNAFDQLTDVWTPDHQWWHYTYDALGRRTTKQHLATDGTVLERTDYTWDGTTLLEQHTATTTTRWTHHPGTHTSLTQATQSEIDREFHAIITDLVGTPTELIDATTGETSGQMVADLWGTAHWVGGAATQLRFPGQIHDPETGLHSNFHRVYDPVTGRYLTNDPLGLGGGPNPTSYVPNPTVWIDPLGLVAEGCRVTVYRTQREGGHSERVHVGPDGSITITGDNMLHVNMSNNIAHSEAFRGPGFQIVAFDVPRSFVDDIRNAAIPQRRPSGVSRREWNISSSGKPQIDDPKVGPDLYGIPSNLFGGENFSALLDAIIPGSGRVIR